MSLSNHKMTYQDDMIHHNVASSPPLQFHHSLQLLSSYFLRTQYFGEDSVKYLSTN